MVDTPESIALTLVREWFQVADARLLTERDRASLEERIAAALQVAQGAKG